MSNEVPVKPVEVTFRSFNEAESSLEKVGGAIPQDIQSPAKLAFAAVLAQLKLINNQSQKILSNQNENENKNSFSR